MPYPVIEISRLALREGNSKKPVYAMHKWWARRLGTIFRMLLLAHGQTGPGDHPRTLLKTFYSSAQLRSGFTVLDPFLGGGTSLVEAAKLGADCIGVDIDPVACFVTQLELRDIDPELIRQHFHRIEGKLQEQLRSYYRSVVDGQQVEVIYYFWVDRVECQACGTSHDGHPTYQLAYDRTQKSQDIVCPECGSISSSKLNAKKWNCPNCSARVDLGSPPVRRGVFHCPTCSVSEPLSTLYSKGAARPRLFALEYQRDDLTRCFAATTPHDERMYQRAAADLAQQRDSLPIPRTEIPSQGRVDQRPLTYGYKTYEELFNARQLLCLGAIGREIQTIEHPSARQALALALSHSLATNNMFCGYAFGYRRLTPLFSVHSYRKISRPVEGNVWGIEQGRGSFSNCVRAVIAGKEYMRHPYEFKYGAAKSAVRVSVRPSTDDKRADRQSIRVLNRSSEDLSPILSESVDLILTDPPYFDNISYSELSDFYHAWLRAVLRDDYLGMSQAHTPLQSTLFARRRSGDVPGRDAAERYTDSVLAVFGECNRVLKAKGKMVFTFHHTSERAWSCLGSAVIGAGFMVTDIFPVRSEGRSGLHSYEGTIKWDSVFTCSRVPGRAFIDATPRVLANVAAKALETAAYWRRRIARAKLEFRSADEMSLARSFVLLEYSKRRLDPSSIPACLQAF